MAAVLKKRAVAEFSHVIQEEDLQPPPPKKLRLINRQKEATQQQLDLLNCQSPREILQILLELERNIPSDAELVRSIVSCLLERFAKETESAVRAKIARLVGKLAKSGGLNLSNTADDLINLLKLEKSHSVLSQLLAALLNIVQAASGNVKLQRQVLDCAYKFLNDTSHLVRCKCLELIGSLGSPDHDRPDRDRLSSTSRPSALAILAAFSHDADGRVRTQAFKSMLLWHQRGIKLDQSAYHEVCGALSDDHEEVRIVAVKLVWVFSQLYADSIVKVSDSSSNSLRLVDDGFGKICCAVNDISLRVRAEAASLLGSMRGVSPHFLEQTLDKKLMSNMRQKRSAYVRQKESYESGEWSTGQKWADDAPKDGVDPDSVSIISNGACGAFVHGLEDEFLEVRNAATDSLCQLAASSPTFAKLSQDFLVDMFNDEIESVRLNAINSLRKICHHFQLREDQLEIIVSVLKDSNHEIRESLHEMLCCCRVSMKQCLSNLVLTLLDNLSRYPVDRQSIWRCMMHLSKNHRSLVLAMAPDLLSSHPYFESIEPDVDDPAYVSILVMVFNAAVDSPTMLPLYPGHLPSHYTYLRNMLPDLVPRLSLPGVSHFDKKTAVNATGSTVSFLSQTLRRLQPLTTMNRNAAVQLMQIGIRDLRQVELIEPDHAATAHCLTLYLRCHLLFDKAVQSYARADSVFKSSQDISQQMVLINKMRSLLLRMEHLFLGLGARELATVRQLALRASALHVLAVLRDGGTESAANRKQNCSQFVSSLVKLQEQLQSSGCAPDMFTVCLLDDLSTLRSADASVCRRVLSNALSQNTVRLLSFDGQLQRVGATLTEPTDNSELPLKFTAGLTLAVQLTAVLDNIQHIDRIRIQVKYPDHQTHLVAPPTLDFKQLSLFKYKLVTKVLLSHVLWSESCPVQLCVVLLCPSEDDSSTSPSPASGSIPSIELCKPVPVTILPVPSRR